MNLTVLFFGATAEITGQRRVDGELPPEANEKDVCQQLVEEYIKVLKHRLHFSGNQQFATGDEILKDGDELAIFTAVSGG